MYFHKLNPFSPTKTSRQKDATWALWIKIIIACVPAAILGLLLDDWMEAHLFNAYVVAAALIVYGVLFIVLENSSVCTNPRFNKAGQISAKTAFLIGMVQLLALIPGTSAPVPPFWAPWSWAVPGLPRQSFHFSWEFRLCLEPVC